MIKKSRSLYITNPNRLAGVISAIQAMGVYEFYKLDFKGWADRITGDEKQAEQDAIRGELARQEQHVRGVIKDANDTCLDADSVLGSELYDREKQSTDHVNGIWVRGSSFTDDE